MKLLLKIPWKKFLQSFFVTKEWKNIFETIETEYKEKNIFPKKKDVFAAFNLTNINDLSVVIIGQDPYHQPGQAHGLAFSVANGVSLPPSLKNIYKEIELDLQITKDFSQGNLESWARQGVLLLNSVLTVQENNPGSHANIGWEEFTDYVIQKISDERKNIVFLLWGNYAKKKGSIVDQTKHLVLETSHPSPLGAYRGFMGCKHFSQTNKYLKKQNKKEIKW